MKRTFIFIKILWYWAANRIGHKTEFKVEISWRNSLKNGEILLYFFLASIDTHVHININIWKSAEKSLPWFLSQNLTKYLFKGLLLKLKSFQHRLIKFKQIWFLIQHLSLVPPAGWENTGKLKLAFHSCYLSNYKQFLRIFFKMLLYLFILPQLFFICLSNTWNPWWLKGHLLTHSV